MPDATTPADDADPDRLPKDPTQDEIYRHLCPEIRKRWKPDRLLRNGRVEQRPPREPPRILKTILTGRDFRDILRESTPAESDPVD